jgi:hypothetical protein
MVKNSKKNYDKIIMIRPDLHIYQPLPDYIMSDSSRTLWSPKVPFFSPCTWLVPQSWIPHIFNSNSLNDQLVIGNAELMMLFCQYASDNLHAEWICTHDKILSGSEKIMYNISTEIILSKLAQDLNIKFPRFDYNYTIIRTDNAWLLPEVLVSSKWSWMRMAIINTHEVPSGKKAMSRKD